MSDCVICAKQARPDFASLVVGSDDLVVVSHRPPAPPEPVYLGYLFVEVRRHVRGFADLTPEEAGAVGRHAAQASRALKAAMGAEHVYGVVIGDLVHHFHLHLRPRYAGTPREHWGIGVDEWPEAPRADADAVADAVRRLRAVPG